MTRISAYFNGEPGGALDKACKSLFEHCGGAIFLGAGTKMAGDGAGERDVEYYVPDLAAEDCRKRLRAAGFRLQPTT